MSRGGSGGHGGSGGARGGGGGHSGGTRGGGLSHSGGSFSGGPRGGSHSGSGGGIDGGSHGGPGLFDYYVPMYWEGSYMGIEVVLIALVVLALVLAYIVTYQSPITDQLATMKTTFMNAQMGTITVLLGLTLLSKSYSKTEGILIRRLLVIFCLLTISLVGFYAVRLKWDETYTEGEFIMQYLNSGETSEFTEDYYVSECQKLYLFFRIKSYGTIILNLVCVVLLGAQIISAIYIQGQKDKRDKDDKIMFDDEINCRY